MQGGKAGNIRFFLLCILIAFCAVKVRQDITALKTDPVCEHARAALDTINAKNEEHHVRIKTK